MVDNRMKLERFSKFLSLAFIFGIVFGFVFMNQQRKNLLHARMPEEGGWMPSNYIVEAGQELLLEITSDDVVHGFAIGRMDDFEPINIYPGEITEVRLVFVQPGTYTYYCTRWCGVNHWRMRGTIEVTGDGEVISPQQPAPYLALGIDIDAEHSIPSIPSFTPSAERGGQFRELIPSHFFSENYFLQTSPYQTWLDLSLEPSLAEYSEADLWDMVAAIWQQQIPAGELQIGAEIYAENCAACHGLDGSGDGVFAEEIVNSLSADSFMVDSQIGQTSSSPTDFTDLSNMLGASPALLHGKIVRGGMGTGMPYWGSIFTDEQQWAVSNYLWEFSLDISSSP